MNDFRPLQSPSSKSEATLEAIRRSQRSELSSPNLEVYLSEVGDLHTHNSKGVSKEFSALQEEIQREYIQIQQERKRVRAEEAVRDFVDIQLLDQMETLKKPAENPLWSEVTGYNQARHEYWMETNATFKARQENHMRVSGTFLESERNLRDVQKIYDQAFQLEKQGKKIEALKLLKEADRTLDDSLVKIKGSSYHASKPMNTSPASYETANNTAGVMHAGLVIARDGSKMFVAAAPTPIGPALAFGTSAVGNVAIASDARSHGKSVEEVKAEFVHNMIVDAGRIAIAHGAGKLGAGAASKIGASTRGTEVAGVVVGKVTESTVTSVGNRAVAGKPIFDRYLPVEIAAGSVTFGQSRLPGFQGVASNVARRAGEVGVVVGLEQVANNDSDSVKNGAGKGVNAVFEGLREATQ